MRWLFLFLLLASTPARALPLRSVEVGEPFEVVFRSEPLASVERAMATTVHAPRARSVELVSRWSELEVSPQGEITRIEGFRLRALAPGKIDLDPVLVEGPGKPLEPLPGTTLQALPPPEEAPWSLVLGTGSLGILGLFLAMRQKKPVPTSREASRGPAPKDRLQDARQARLTGDVRSFYVQLYGALKQGLGDRTGTPPRDRASVLRALEELQVPPRLRRRSEDLLEVCERVVFAGGHEPAESMNENFELATELLGAIEAPKLPRRKDEPSHGRGRS